MDDVGKLVLFRDVVETGGFSRAAERRGLSHSTVSKHVQSLERTLGARLLNRTSRTMSLTEAGRLVLTHSRSIGASVEALHASLDELRGEVLGALRIQSLVHVGRHLVQPAIATYLAAHPRARVELVLDDGPLHFTRDGYDLAVRVGLDAEGSLSARKLVDNGVLLVASPSLLDRIDPPTHPRDLASLPTVGYRAGAVVVNRWRYEEDGEVHAVAVAPVAEVNEGTALLDLAVAGIGIAYLSAFAAEAALRDGRLVRLLEDFPLPPYDPVYLLRASGGLPSLKVRAFEGHLRAVAAG